MNFSKYINLLYKNLGRDFNGVDCFGLLYLIFREERNIVLPDYTELKYNKEWYKHQENHIINNINDSWIRVSKPYKTYDAIIFYNFGRVSSFIANHIGMYIGDNKFIHIMENTTSRVNNLDSYWVSKLYGTIRYKEVS
uniref:Putative tail protein n=1 Tax=viral metagenome TaxID=1070528 RepID=A0A6H1ZJZ9_9ZZZZ